MKKITEINEVNHELSFQSHFFHEGFISLNDTVQIMICRQLQ